MAFTKEQQELFDRSGARNDWIVGLVCIIICFAIVGINIFCRYNDNRKLRELEFTTGLVTSRGENIDYIGRKRLIEDSINVEYTPEGSWITHHFYDPDGPYDFIYKGDTLRVFYEKDDPDKAYIAKTDWITGEYVRADINYETAFIIAIFPLFTGLFFFAEELTVRKNIKKGTFKLKKSDGLYPNEALHEIARISNAKRSWNLARVCLFFFYLFALAVGVFWIMGSVNSDAPDATGRLAGGIIVLIFAHFALAGVIISSRYINRKKRAFIKGFMADDATSVYKDREKAAEVLWKHVKRFMEAETFNSRYKYDYSGLWLTKFEDELKDFRNDN